MTTLGFRSLSRIAFGFILVLIIAAIAHLAQAQSPDDVHVLPLDASAAPQPTKASAEAAPSLARLGKPLRVDVDLVLVPVTVNDRLNRPITGLAKEDFLLSEGGQPQQIKYFLAEDAPISIGVLLDTSKSMTNKIDSAREALAQFFEAANPQDDYFVVTFGDNPAVLADTTQSIGEIQGKLAMATPAGHTALLDAIYLAINKTRSARYKRRALLIISDGGDNHSRYRPSEIKRLVQEADLEIYAIGIFDTIFKTPEEWAGKRLLTTITEATGGRTVTLSNPRQLPEIAATISHELRNQYILGYRPSNAARNGQWRKIDVKVQPSAQNAALQVHFRRGYLGPEE